MSTVKQVNTFSWKIGGEAGFGVMASGTIFAKTCMRAGLHIFDYSEYPSLIRGGHNTYQVFASDQTVRSWRRSVNILVALNRETVEAHLDELSPHGAVVYDTTDHSFTDFHPPKGRSDLQWIGIPLTRIALQAGGELFMRNTVAVGTSFALLSVDLDFPSAVVKDIFKDKPPAVIASNLSLLKAGYDAVDSKTTNNFPWDLNPLSQSGPQIFVSGNEALGLGAIQAGCKFYAAYPMTPSSTILAFLAEHGPKYGMVVRHAEDEIGVINETIGAAHAGVRAICGTAGGGFSLMTEAVGMAGMTETGIVIFEAQRGGPSTGLPTWTEQADFLQVLNASQGDFLKVVLAPGDIQECFTLTQLAMNLAEQLQTPVIVMTDKYLAESHATVPPLTEKLPITRGQVMAAKNLPCDDSFQRYRTDVKDGISPRSLPGMPHGLFVANSDEHTTTGFSSETAEMRIAQMHKRARKFTTAASLVPSPKLIGPAQAEATLVGWGSSKGVIQDALEILAAEHEITANFVHLNVLNPFPAAEIQALLKTSDLSIMVEANQSGQVAGWIKQQTGHTFDHHVRQYDGRPFEAAALAQTIHDLIA